MDLLILEILLRYVIGFCAIACLIAIYFGISRSVNRPVKSEKGAVVGYPRTPLFYLVSSLLFFGFCWLIWHPLPINPNPPMQTIMLISGSLLSVSGLGLVLWGRLALGQYYNLSSATGAPLYADQCLIVQGPYAIIRHPMYVGLFMAAIGGILVYQVWTLVFFWICTLGLPFRARREEQALAARFGEAWTVYCQQTPAWLPRLRTKKEPGNQGKI